MIKSIKYELQTLLANSIKYIWSWYMSILLFPYHLTRSCIIFILSKIFKNNYKQRRSSLPPIIQDCCNTMEYQSRPINRLRPQSSPNTLNESLPTIKRQLSTKSLLNREILEFKQKLNNMSLIQLINYYEYIFMMERKQTLSKLDPLALRKILLGAVHRYGTSNVIRDQIILNAKGYIYLSPCNLGSPLYLRAPDSNFSLNRIWSRRPLLDYFLSKHSLN